PDLGPGRDDDDLRRALGIDQHVAAALDRGQLLRVSRLRRQCLAGEYETSRSIRALERGAPRRCSLRAITGTPELHAGDRAQARELLDRLVGRAVLAEADRIMGEDEIHPDFH